MFNHGLINEVTSLLDRGWRDTNAIKSVGYEELIPWLDNKKDNLESIKEEIKTNTRRYAKRQLTWFRRNKRINWLDANSVSVGEMVSTIVDSITD